MGLKKFARRMAFICLLALAAGLIYWRIMRGYIPTAPDVAWPSPPDWVARLYTLRWIVRALLIAAGLGLAFLEWQTAALSKILRDALARRFTTALLIGLLAALLGTYVFQPGNYYIADYRADVSMPWAVLQLLRQGNFPVIWTTYVHMGSPFMQLHPSIFYYAAGLLGLLVPNFFDGAEVMYFLLLLISAVLMFIYMLELTDSPLAAFVAVVAWNGSFFRLQQIAYGANTPLSAILAFWPLEFYFIERVLKSSRAIDVRGLSWVALSAALMIGIHPLHGAWFIPLGLMYASVRSLFASQTPISRRTVKLLGLALAHLAAVLIGAYVLAPELLESQLVSGIGRDPGMSLENILDLAHQWGGGFLSYSILGLAVLGVVLVLICRYRRAYALALQAILLFLLMLAPRYFPAINDVLTRIPLGSLLYARGSARYLLVAFGPVAALTGIFAELLPVWLQSLWRGRAWGQPGAAIWPIRLAMLSTVLILVDRLISLLM